MTLIPTKLNYGALGAAAQRLNTKPKLSHPKPERKLSPEETMHLIIDSQQAIQLEYQVEKEGRLALIQQAYDLASQEQVAEMTEAQEHEYAISTGIKGQLLEARAFIPVEFTLRKVVHQVCVVKWKSAWVNWLEFVELHKLEVARLATLEPWVIPIQKDYRRFSAMRKARRKRQLQRNKMDQAVSAPTLFRLACVF
jgi:hypothetical protein